MGIMEQLKKDSEKEIALFERKIDIFPQITWITWQEWILFGLLLVIIAATFIIFAEALTRINYYDRLFSWYVS